MSDATFREKLLAALPTIGGNALKLVVHRLCIGDGAMSDAEVQRALGMSRATYFRAKSEAQQTGFSLTSDTPVSFLRPTSLTSDTAVSTMRPASLTNETSLTAEAPASLTDETAETGDQDVFFGGSGDIGSDIDQMARAADAMDASGDVNSARTPANARRKAQVGVIQQAWHELGLNQHGYCKNLPYPDAGRWLGYCGASATTLLEHMRECAGRCEAGGKYRVENAKAWLDARLKRLGEDQRRPTPAPTTQPPQRGNVRQPVRAAIDDSKVVPDALQPVTPEFRAQMDRATQLAERLYRKRAKENGREYVPDW